MRNSAYPDVVCGTISITRVPSAQISGNISRLKNPDQSCTNTNIELYPASGLSGVNVKWRADSPPVDISSSIDANSKFNLVSSEITSPLQLLYLTSVTPPSDYSVEPACVVKALDNSSVGSFLTAEPYLGFRPSTSANISGLNVYNLVYKNRYLVNGWITSFGGDVYSGSHIGQVVPFVPLGDFTGFLLGSKAYAFSNGDIDSGTVGGTPVERVSSGTESGSVEDMGDIKPFSFGITDYDLSTPDRTTQLPVDLDMMGIWNLYGLNSGITYSVGVSEFNNAMSYHTEQYVEYSVTDGGTAVVYIEGNGTVDISKELRSAGGKLLIVTPKDVRIRSNVGTDTPASDSTANISAFILTSGNITIDSTGNKSTELTLIVDGSLVSTKGSVSQNRDRGLENSYPSLVVNYDPAYIYDLTSLEQERAGMLYPNLFLNNVTWGE
jgi:hypothetical protein